MKTVLSVIFFSCLTATQSFAGSATWSANPVSGNWNDPANWLPATVPNGPNDVATFSASSVTNVFFSGDMQLSELVFASDASAYQIAFFPFSVILSGPGITNNSSNAENINFNGSIVSFLGSSNAGNNNGTMINALSGAKVTFYDQSTAGSATLNASNSPSTITFADSSTAGQATISDSTWALVTFTGTSNAGSAQISSSFADISIDSTAYAGPAARFTCNDGSISVYGKNDAQIALNGANGGTLEVGDNTHKSPSVGSITGNGLVVLDKGSTLTLGSNNLSTEYDGAIINDLDSGRCGGLIKVGTGTLTLTAANEYCLGTTIYSGAVVVKNHNGSGTGGGPVTVAGGTLGGRGIISKDVTVGTGAGTGAVIAPSQGASNPITITLQKTLTFKTDGSYLYRLNTKKATADQVIANGVTIESGAQFNFKIVANKKLTLGKVFTAISNTAITAISGTFANLTDGSIVTVGVNKLQVSYSGGDGNDLTLTVVE
jgi:autotransporter-associated beta strand protein